MPTQCLNALDARALPYDPWAAAKDRFLADLSEQERQLFNNVSLENLYYTTSNAQRSHEEESATRRLSKQLEPLTDALEDYGKAMDVISNSFSLYVCPVWGCIRVVLSILQNFENYCKKVVGHLEHLGDILPRLRDYQELFATDVSLLLSLTNAYLVIIKFCCDVKDVFAVPNKHAS